MDKEFLSLIESANELIAHAEKLDDEGLICECFCVSVRDIRELCVSEVNLDQLKIEFNLGQGCQSCLKSKDTWINKIF
jgi:NAD(P)H-nitrite reductase large subunit